MGSTPKFEMGSVDCYENPWQSFQKKQDFRDMWVPQIAVLALPFDKIL